MNKIEEEAFLEWCKNEFPEHRLTIVERELGDIIIVYLHDYCCWSNSKVVTYNQWYPGEYKVFDLKLRE